ncbi:MAG: hypothetical protein AB7K09_08550 [Planctomycetota bacterium]
MQSVNIPTLVTSVLLAAAFSAGVTFALVTVVDPANNHVAPTNLPAAPVASKPAGQDGELKALGEELARLRDQMPASVDAGRIELRLADFAARLQRLERASSAPADRGKDDPADPTATPAPETADAVPPPSALDAAIEAVIERREEEQRAKAEAERAAQIEEGLKRTREWSSRIYELAINKMNTELGLSASQSDGLKNLLDWRLEQLMISRDQRIPRDERPDWNAVNTEYTRRMGDLLSPQQMQIYKEKDLGDFGRYQRELQQQSDGPGSGGNGRGR